MNDAFLFIAGAFTGVAGQLHYVGGVVEGDINGDTVADFAINVVGAPALVLTDFLL